MKETTRNVFKSLFILVFLFSAFVRVCPAEDIPAHKFMVAASGNIFRSPASSYRKIYGSTSFMPEIKFMFLAYRNFGVWGSFAYIDDSGWIEEVDEAASIRQTVLGFGIGYAHQLAAALCLRGELGLAYDSFKEEALAETFKSSGLGLKIGVSLDYRIWKKWFAILSASYSQISDDAQTGKIDLGGTQVGVGIGVVF
jgi:hypothetical protein